MNRLPATFRNTGSAVIGSLDHPFRMYSAHAICVTTGNVGFNDGGVTEYAKMYLTTGSSQTLNFEEGVTFPNGLIMTADVGVSVITITGYSEI